METFDVSSYEDLPTAEFEVKDPVTGGSTPIVIKIGGPEFAPRKRIVQDRVKRMTDRASKMGRVTAPSAEENEETETDILVAATLGWRGLAYEGKPLEFSAEAARTLYTDPKRRWLRDQVKSALDDKDLFIKRSVAT
jgi:hypothetical protein